MLCDYFPCFKVFHFITQRLTTCMYGVFVSVFFFGLIYYKVYNAIFDAV